MQPTAGVYVAVALLWLWRVDGVPPTVWDLVGVAVTAAGRRASTKVLNARDQVIAEGLSVLSNEELVILGALSERVLRARLQSLEHAYRVCRLCCHDACDDCPIDAELRQRALEDG